MKISEIINESARRPRYGVQLHPSVSNYSIKDVPKPFVDAFRAQGITDPNTIVGHYIVSGKETHARGGGENMDYSGTDNSRIRDTFGGKNSQISKMSDDQLNWLKQDPERFGRFVYGGQKAQIVPDAKQGYALQYGSPAQQQQADDGWNYRGRGHLQITGKPQYAKIGQHLFPDEPDKLVKNPNLLSTDHKLGLDASAAYAKLFGKADTKKFDNPVSAVNDALVSVGGGPKFGPGGRMYGQQVQGINDFFKAQQNPKWQKDHTQYYNTIAQAAQPSRAQPQTQTPAQPQTNPAQSQPWYNKVIPAISKLIPSANAATTKPVSAVQPVQQNTASTGPQGPQGPAVPPSSNVAQDDNQPPQGT